MLECPCVITGARRPSPARRRRILPLRPALGSHPSALTRLPALTQRQNRPAGTFWTRAAFLHHTCRFCCGAPLLLFYSCLTTLTDARNFVTTRRIRRREQSELPMWASAQRAASSSWQDTAGVAQNFYTFRLFASRIHCIARSWNRLQWRQRRRRYLGGVARVATGSPAPAICGRPLHHLRSNLNHKLFAGSNGEATRRGPLARAPAWPRGSCLLPQ